MKVGQSLLFLFICCLNLYCQPQTDVDKENNDLRIVQYEELLSNFLQKDDTLYVVNFWATWCVPCVEELPHFLKVNEDFKDNLNYKMTLVSLDSAKKIESNLIPFIEKKNIEADVIVLSDSKRMNTWIPIINEDWSGSIPATAFYLNGKQVFFVEGQMTEEELRNTLKQYIP